MSGIEGSQNVRWGSTKLNRVGHRNVFRPTTSATSATSNPWATSAKPHVSVSSLSSEPVPVKTSDKRDGELTEPDVILVVLSLFFLVFFAFFGIDILFLMRDCIEFVVDLIFDINSFFSSLAADPYEHARRFTAFTIYVLLQMYLFQLPVSTLLFNLLLGSLALLKSRISTYLISGNDIHGSFNTTIRSLNQSLGTTIEVVQIEYRSVFGRVCNLFKSHMLVEDHQTQLNKLLSLTKFLQGSLESKNEQIEHISLLRNLAIRQVDSQTEQIEELSRKDAENIRIINDHERAYNSLLNEDSTEFRKELRRAIRELSVELKKEKDLHALTKELHTKTHDTLSQEILNRRIQASMEDMAALKERIQLLRTEKTEWKAEKSNLRAKLEERRKAMGDLVKEHQIEVDALLLRESKAKGGLASEYQIEVDALKEKLTEESKAKENLAKEHQIEVDALLLRESKAKGDLVKKHQIEVDALDLRLVQSQGRVTEIRLEMEKLSKMEKKLARAQAKSEKALLTAEIEELKEELSKLKETLAETEEVDRPEKQVAGDDKELQEKTERIAKQEAEIDALTKRLAEAQQSTTAAQKQVVRLEEQVTSTAKQAQEKSKQITLQESEIDTLKKRLAETQQTAGAAKQKSEKKLDDLEKQVASTAKEAQAKSEQITKQQSEIDTLKKHQAEDQQTAGAAKQQGEKKLNHLEEQVTSTTKDLQDKSAQIAKQTSELDSLRDQLARSQILQRHGEAESQQKDATITKQRDKISALNRQVAELQAMPEGRQQGADLDLSSGQFDTTTPTVELPVDKNVDVQFYDFDSIDIDPVDVDALKADLAEKCREISEKVIGIANQQNEITTLKNREENLTSQVSGLTDMLWKEKAAAQHRADDHRVKVSNYEDQNLRKDAEISTLRSSVENFKLQVASHQGPIPSSDVAKALQEVPTLRSQIEKLNRALEAEKVKSQKQVEGAESRKQMWMKKIQELENKLTESGKFSASKSSSSPTQSQFPESAVSTPSCTPSSAPSSTPTPTQQPSFEQAQRAGQYRSASRCMNGLYKLIKQRKPDLFKREGGYPADFPELSPSDECNAARVNELMQELGRAYHQIAIKMRDQSWSMSRYMPTGKFEDEQPKASDELLSHLNAAVAFARNFKGKSPDWSRANEVLKHRS